MSKMLEETMHFYNERPGDLRKIAALNQRDRASGLNLIVATSIVVDF